MVWSRWAIVRTVHSRNFSLQYEVLFASIKPDGFLYEGVGLWVNIRRGLVHHEDFVFLEHSTSQAEQLPLTHR